MTLLAEAHDMKAMKDDIVEGGEGGEGKGCYRVLSVQYLEMLFLNIR